MNLTIYLLSYFIIIISVVGFGLIFQSILKNYLYLEFEYNLLGSLFFLIFLSFFTHFFFSHGYIHNLIILLTGFLSSIFFFFREKKIFKKYFIYILLIFGLLIIAFLTAKTHDDFPYYHFPYTYYLTQENLIIGMGNLNHGFRTPSSIFYLNSLFYLPIIKYFSFNMGAILIFGFSNLILIFKLKNDYEKKTYDFVFILTLLSFLFINVFFYRLAEHGTDRSAQILILILFVEVFSLFRNTGDFEKFFHKIFIILGLTISLKAFYVLYLLILPPIFFYFRKYDLVKIFFKNFYFYIFIFVGFFLILINIFNSGCILYPVSFTCLNNLDWSLANEATKMNNFYEQWSKAGATPNFRVNDPENYIKGFNWVPNWIDTYFFNKVSDFILGLFFLLFLVLLTLFSKNKFNIKINKKNYVFYLIILILFFEWFYNHPSLRYGGYTLVALILFVPFSMFVSKFISIKYIKEKIIFLIILSLTVFSGRNIDRIHNEINKYNYDFLSHPFYNLDENHFRINKFTNEIFSNYENCTDEIKTNCSSLNGISINKKGNYYVLRKIND